MKSALPLRVAVPLAVAALSLLLAGALIAYDRLDSYRSLEATARLRGTSLSHIVVPAIEHAIQSGNDTDASDQVSRLALEPDVTYAAVFDEGNRVRFATDFRSVNAGARDTVAAGALPLIARVRETMALQAEQSADGTALRVASPFLLPPLPGELRPTRTAVLYVHMDLARGKQALVREMLGRSALVAGISFMGCGLLWLFLRARVIRQLDALLDRGRAVPNAPIDGDELAQISAMMSALRGEVLTEHVARRESEEKFARVFAAAPVMMTLSALDTGLFTDVNEAAIALTGYTADELRGRSALAIGWFTDEQQARISDMLKADGRVVGLPVQARRKDGQRVDALYFAEIVIVLGEPTVLSITQDISELRLSQQALLESERRFRKLVDRAPIAIAIARRGIVEYVNQAFAAMYGASDTRLFVGEAVGSRVAPEARASFVERALRRARGEPVDEHYETTGVRLDGTPFPMLASASLVEMADGPASIGFFQDVTQRRRAEAQLRDSEARFRAIVENSHDGIIFVDAGGTVVYRSPSFDQITGYTIADRVGRSAFGLILQEDLPAVQAAFADCTTQPNRLTHVSFRARHEAGHSIRLEAALRNLLDNPSVQAIVATVRDITDRTAIEEEREKLYRAVESSGEAIFLTDRAGTFTYVNPAFTALYDYTAAEVVGSATPRILKSNVSGPHAEGYAAFWKGLLGGQTLVTDYVNRTKDGRLVDVHGSASPIIDANGQVLGFLGVHQDRTEARKAEEDRARLRDELQQAQKMEAVGRLAGGVAHDFNNMLSVIMLSLEMAQSALDPSHPAAADLDEIHDAAQRSAELTRQLLAFARRQPAALEPVDVNDVVRGGLSMLGRLIGENITLASDVANRPLRVLADRAQLTQIVTNLVVNARDAIDGVGTVRISTGAVTVDEPFCATRPDARPGAYVQLLVADNGAGMDKSVLDRIFEPFFTTKGAHGPKAGTGLGLATVYGIVRQNGGFIDVTSEPGAGSAFTIYWPELSAPVAAATPETRHKATRGRETILLVEDEPALLKLTTKVLTAFGYRVMSARTPQEALDLSNRVTERIDLLLTDVILPEMNGRELSERLRAHRPGLKCLFTSGYTADHIGTHGVLDPGVDFIAKPWTNDSLGMKLREVLDQV